jgi:hypothetical protein
MVVGFTTTYAIGAYNHWCCDFESQLGWGVQHYMITVSSTNKTDGHDITEILMKVALNTIKQTNTFILWGTHLQYECKHSVKLPRSALKTVKGFEHTK